jgi:hypothetical protein
VTRRPSTAAGRQRFELDQNLIRAEALRFGLPPENIAAVLSTFGPMPEQGQRELLRHIPSALSRYWFQLKASAPTAVRVTPSEQRNRLKLVEKTARKLLSLFGVKCRVMPPRCLLENSPIHTPSQRLRILQRLDKDGRPLDPKARPEALAAVMDATAGAILVRLAAAGINPTDGDADRVNVELAAASDRTAEVVISLLWLHSQAEAAVRDVRTRKGHGGARRRPTPKGALIRGAVSMYAHLREQYPKSGKKPRYGGPMLRFIRAVAALAGACVTDSEIKDVWKSRNSSQK